MQVSLKLLAPVLIALLVWGVYSSGISGPFLFDDAPNISENKKIKIENLSADELYEAAYSTKAGPLNRPVSMLSFALNYYISGMDSKAFKITNLLIHLAVGLAVFWVTFQIFSMVIMPSSMREINSVWCASCLVAAIFLIHPLNLSSVLYVVQRMNSLAALFLFLALGAYLEGRRCLFEVNGKNYRLIVMWTLSALVFFPLAVLSKENAILLPFLVLVIESVLLGWGGSKNKLLLMSLLKFGLWVGVATVVVLVILNWQWLEGGYVHRDFSLEERVLTEPRVLLMYLFLIMVPNIREMTFYHDDIVISTSLFSGEVLVSIAVWAVLLVSGYCLKAKFKWFLFAIVWFLVAHSMESSIVALELVHEHRNYVPMYGLLLLVGVLFYYGFQSPMQSAKAKTLSLLMVAVMSFSTAVRAGAWGNIESLVERQYRLNKESPRSNYALGNYLFAKMLVEKSDIKKRLLYKQMLPYFLAVGELDHTDFSGYLALIRLNDQLGYPVNNEWLDAAAHRAKTYPLGQSSLIHVQDFLHCQLGEYCNVGVEDLGPFIDAVLMNSTLDLEYETTIKADFGVFLSMKGNYSDASRYLVDVVHNKPSWWVFRLAAVAALEKAGLIGQAIGLITETKTMDVPDDLRATFHKIELQLISDEGSQ